MNTENFKRVLDHIKAHPETWDQDEWHCGTKHCFAGHAQIFSGIAASEPEGKFFTKILEDAMIFLEVSYSESCYLFAANRSIFDFERFLAEHEASQSSGAT